MKDTPFATSICCHPQEESSCPLPSTNTHQGRQGSWARPHPHPSPIPYAHRCWGASAGGRCGLHAPTSGDLKHTDAQMSPGKGGTSTHPISPSSQPLMTSPSQGLGKLAWAEPLGSPRRQWDAAEERETQAAVRHKFLPCSGSRFSGFSTEGHLLPVSEPNSRQPGTSPPPHQAPTAFPCPAPPTAPQPGELLNLSSPGTPCRSGTFAHVVLSAWQVPSQPPTCSSLAIIHSYPSLDVTLSGSPP